MDDSPDRGATRVMAVETNGSRLALELKAAEPLIAVVRPALN